MSKTKEVKAFLNLFGKTRCENSEVTLLSWFDTALMSNHFFFVYLIQINVWFMRIYLTKTIEIKT